MKKIDIVIPYILTDDNGEELRYCLRAIDKNFITACDKEIWLLGDSPKWIRNVNVIPMRRVTGMNYMSFFDTAGKMLAACNIPCIGNEFIWLNDDIYFIKPTSLADLKVSRAVFDAAEKPDWYGKVNASAKWRNLLMETLVVLKEAGKRIVNYESHLPYLFEKEKIKFLFDKFKLSDRPRLIATLYYNYYEHEPVLEMKKLGVYNAMRKDEIKNMADSGKYLWMNNSVRGYCEGLKAFLKEEFGEKSSYEL